MKTAISKWINVNIIIIMKDCLPIL
jgi:hypothetical protein